MCSLANDELTLTIKEIREYFERFEMPSTESCKDEKCGKCPDENPCRLEEYSSEIIQTQDAMLDEMIVDAQKKICCR